MNLKSALQRLPFLGGPSSILVCETDGFHLRGAVLSRHADEVKIDCSAHSDTVEYRQAVKELIGSLRQQGWKGRDAILLTPAVFSTLVELPVSPKHPRSPLQMQELIRWELEPLLMQHAASWSIGQMLLAMGYLNAEQVTSVLDRQQGKQKGSVGDGHGSVYSFKRYGELAVEMGFVSQQQMDECLARQAWLRSESDEFSCGWVPQIARRETGYEDELNGHDGVHPWLVSGANIGMMRQWGQAFAAHKVVLDEVYPLIGGAAELIERDDGVLLLETLHNTVTGLRMHAGAIDMLRLQQGNSASMLETCLESYHDLVNPDVHQVWLATSGKGARGLVAEFGAMTGREVQHLREISPQVSAGMMGVAEIVLQGKPPRYIAGVSVRGPQPPIFQRVEVRAIAAAVLILLVIATLEASLYIRKDLAQAEHGQTAEAKKKFDAVVASAQAKVDAVTKLKADIQAKEGELGRMMARFDFFAIELPTRSAFVQTLLNELSNNVTEDVVINVLEETPNLGFRIAGWALSETAVQQFIQSFQAAMAPLEMDVADPIVRAQSGRLGMLGYDFHFRLVSAKVATPAASTVQPATPAQPAQPARRQRTR